MAFREEDTLEFQRVWEIMHETSHASNSTYTYKILWKKKEITEIYWFYDGVEHIDFLTSAFVKYFVATMLVLGEMSALSGATFTKKRFTKPILISVWDIITHACPNFTTVWL